MATGGSLGSALQRALNKQSGLQPALTPWAQTPDSSPASMGSPPLMYVAGQPVWLGANGYVDAQGRPLDNGGDRSKPISPLAPGAGGSPSVSHNASYWKVGTGGMRIAQTPEEAMEKLSLGIGLNAQEQQMFDSSYLVSSTQNTSGIGKVLSLGATGASVGGAAGGVVGAGIGGAIGIATGGGIKQAGGGNNAVNNIAALQNPYGYGTTPAPGGVQGGFGNPAGGTPVANSAWQGGRAGTGVQGGYGSGGTTGDPYLDALNQYSMQIQGNAGQLESTLNQTGYMGARNAADANNVDQGYLNQLAGATSAANSGNNAALGQYTDTMNTVNAFNGANYAGLQGQYGAMANPLSPTGYLGDVATNQEGLNNQRTAFSQLQGAANGSLDYQSQGAQAYADPRAISAQYTALGQLQNAANGSLNVNSQAANAYADEEAIRMQRQGLDDLYSVSRGLNDVSMDPGMLEAIQGSRKTWAGIANGDLDVNLDPQLLAKQQEGLQGFKDVYGGSLDVGMDQNLLAKQNSALDQYDQWRHPQLTAEEDFMKEQARLEEEQQQGANRSAVYQNLSDRGMGGSGMELANTQLGSQQNSQNRLLRDLGANANAVQRAGAALAGYGQLSGAMQDQYLSNAHANNDLRYQGLQNYGDMGNAMQNQYLQNAQFNTGTKLAGQQGYSNETNFQASLDAQIQTGNMDRRTQALGLYVDEAGQMRSQSFDEAYKRGLAGDQVAMSNADRMLQASGMSADEANQIRNASFNEAYSRGIAADNASANNQQTRMQGMTNSGNLATNMRQQSDAITMFNQQQHQTQNQFQDLYNQNERNDAWGRTTDLYGAGERLGATTAVNAGAIFGGQTGVNQTNLANTGGLINTATGLNQTGYNRTTSANNALATNAGIVFGAQNGVAGAKLGSAQGAQANANANQGLSWLGAPTIGGAPPVAPLMPAGTPTYRKAYGGF